MNRKCCGYTMHSMKARDTSDVLTSAVAVTLDAAAVMGGFMLATWIKFDSGLVSVAKGRPPDLYFMYFIGACFATLILLVVFRSMGLFVRPQMGSFVNKIPRLIKAVAVGIVLTAGLGFAVKTQPPYSTEAVLIALFSVTFLVLLERYVLFRIEWNVARHSRTRNHVLILGTDSVAARLTGTLNREPMLRTRVVGFLRTDRADPDPSIRAEQIKGSIESLGEFLAGNRIDRIILADSRLGHERIVEIIFLCERNLIDFNMVPDLFRVMTSSMDVQSLDDIPLLGISRWPLDILWNRLMKRGADIVGSVLGLLLTGPGVALAGMLVKRDSPGPMFYAQERCGESGDLFTLFKLRTMRTDAEADTGPVFAVESDPRITGIGAFLRRHNVDELPQLWNVLKGQMSLVGPRPERPHFVEQFREDIARYMWRHVSKPGMTGWAQVNGMRGNTSIEERIKYDLYYLENWSLAFDFKILMKTLFARENAY